MCESKDGEKQERPKETTFMDLIKSNKKGLHHVRFSVSDVSSLTRLLKFSSTDRSLSSTSGALLNINEKSALNYICMLPASKKSKQ